MTNKEYEILTEKQKKILVLLARGFAPSEIDEYLMLPEGYSSGFAIGLWEVDDLSAFKAGAEDNTLALELKQDMGKIVGARPVKKERPKVPARILKLREETKCNA